jgi:protein TonB
MDIPAPEISNASAAEPVPAPETSEKKPPAPAEEAPLSPDSLDIPAPSSEALQPAEMEPIPDLPEAKHPPDTAEPAAEQNTALNDIGPNPGDGKKDTKETTRTHSTESMDTAGQKRIHRATPLYKSNPLPRYPSSARRRGFEGTVTLLVQVSEKGNVTDLDVDRSSGYKSLDRRAVETVKDWKFEPGRINGEAAAMKVKIPVTFRLE